MPAQPALVWFREDLRLDDNPALAAAAAAEPVIGLYIFEEGLPDHRPLGGASRWWLHHSLEALRDSLAGRGVTLILRRGDPRTIVPQVAAETGASGVFWNRRYLPWSIPVDTAVKQALVIQGTEARSFRGNLLIEPMEPRTGTGGPFKVYSPFFRAVRAICEERAAVAGAPVSIAGATVDPAALHHEDLDSWALLPRAPDWAGGLRAAWQPGEDGARALATSFFADQLSGYGERRNLPGSRTTSRLSPHIRFGEISVARLWSAAAASHAPDRDVETFHKELAWREFSHHLLHHWPHLASRNWKSDFDRFAWSDDGSSLAAWQKGLTGYPIVDAGMRELWTTGWMHNRVRMIAASFLIKHLLIDWRAGERWFWDTLVDADAANNAASWQWVAGSGADAAPYFRIFNPYGQGEKFDADGAYVRRWVPELARLPDNLIHQPWTATPAVLSSFGVVLGKTYPRPIVDHARARVRALETYQRLKTA